MRAFFKAKLIISLILTLIIVSSGNFCLYYLISPGALNEEKTVIIPKGLSKAEIAVFLSKESIISNPTLFKYLAKIYGSYRPIKSGEYSFTQNISPIQILKILSEGKSVIHKLVIPEGLMVSEILIKINAEPRLFGDQISDITEGYLMPSTYFYSYGDLKTHIIEQMKKGMTEAVDEAMSQLSSDSPLKTRSDVLILASIVEKEAVLDSEKPLIAAVFINRLKKGMRLQADPTTAYALTEGQYKLDRLLTKKDLEINSQYNTYYVSGLPKGAISCPGKASLMAVVKPSKSDALYFVARGDGSHNFSNNLNDHNNNVMQYRNQKNTVINNE